MKVQLCLALLLAAGFSAMAQNRIPNPSFEIYNTDCTAGGMNTNNVWGWATPQCSTVGSYYNTCFDQPDLYFAAVPNNVAGYAMPVDGDAYVSLFTYSDDYTQGNPKNFLTVSLWEPLEAGETYCLSLWASLCDNAAYRTNDLHCYLAIDTPSACGSNPTAMAGNAAVVMNTSAIDTAGWSLLEGTFTALGGEATLTIGDFNQIPNLDTTFITDQQPLINVAAYYIDQVYLGACDNAIDEDQPEQQLLVFPSPATSQVHLTLNESVTNAIIEVFDAQGRIQLAQRMTGTQHVLDVTSLSNGMNHVRVTQGREYFLSSFTVQH